MRLAGSLEGCRLFLVPPEVAKVIVFLPGEGIRLCFLGVLFPGPGQAMKGILSVNLGTGMSSLCCCPSTDPLQWDLLFVGSEVELGAFYFIIPR